MKGEDIMSSKLNEIKRRYHHEISDIEYKLRLLELGRVTELTRSNSDGYLSTNVNNLRKSLNDLFSKVINESDSDADKISEIFNK